MSFIELLILAVGVSMDAFAVAVCKGLALRKATLRQCTIVGLWFGGFQILMPLLGYFFGSQLSRYITSVDHFIAFVLLLIIGGNMIREALSSESEDADDSLGFKKMFGLAIVTSIDALAVGITLSLLQVNIFSSVSFIGVTTFLFSFAGVKIGNIFGYKYKSGAEIAGGIILILIGFKILLEHLGILSI